MIEPQKIYDHLDKYFANLNKNKKLKVLITAGPTQEAIDPVRFISNYSSGKQGYEIARAFAECGYDTTLISGPTNLNAPRNIKFIKVITADQMYNETIKNLPVDVAVFAAAVSDFKVKNYENLKIKKSKNIELSLEENIDILSYVSKHNSLRPKIVIGFCAETNNIHENSIKKLDSKSCDWIISNDISRKDIGFSSEMNQVSIYFKNNKIEKLPKMKKNLIADELVKRVNNQIN